MTTRASHPANNPLNSHTIACIALHLAVQDNAGAGIKETCDFSARRTIRPADDEHV
jgi:hypothetical protein